ncbi:MAG: LysM peptidoglycan-binding domain-containing protein [Lachnospiraceae bacterium]|nr:LysM peptidoglycan-binding domain-containing protein [Lachnospiraceae bacterium]
MELPKNIIQIGKPDKLHKIFVEDYVVSYIKQTNRKLQGSQAGLAFYGRKSVEDNIRYYFLYGASEIEGLERRGQYLSELERESIEAVQKEYFAEYEFLAWCTLAGEMPDGFYLMEQGKGLRIDGYACFFEKNDCMLNFMVAEGNREREREKQQRDAQASADASPAAEEERFRQRPGSQTKEWGRLTGKGNIDHRLEERSRKLEEMRGTQVPYRKSRVRTGQRMEGKNSMGKKTPGMQKRAENWKPILVGAAVLLCVLGIATLGDEERRRELQVIARQVMESLGEQKLPDQLEEIPGDDTGNTGNAGQTAGNDEASGKLPEISDKNPADGDLDGQSQSGENQSTEGQDPGSQGMDGQEQDDYGTDNVSGESQSPESQGAENQSSGEQNPENQSAVSQAQEGQSGQDAGGQDAGGQGGQDDNGQESQSGQQPEESGDKGESQQAGGQAATVAYVIQKGDTLLNICRKRYGTESRLHEICELNGITNADDIKIGQVILLPE